MARIGQENQDIFMVLPENRPVPLSFVRDVMLAGVYLLGLFTMGVPKVAGAEKIFLGMRDYYLGRTGEKLIE